MTADRILARGYAPNARLVDQPDTRTVACKGWHQSLPTARLCNGRPPYGLLAYSIITASDQTTYHDVPAAAATAAGRERLRPRCSTIGSTSGAARPLPCRPLLLKLQLRLPLLSPLRPPQPPLRALLPGMCGSPTSCCPSPADTPASQEPGLRL